MLSDKTKGSPPVAGKVGEQEGGISFLPYLGLALFVSSVFFLSALSRTILAPILPAVETDLGINHTQAGSLFLMISFGYFSGLLGSGFISARVGHGATVTLSAMSVGLTMALVPFYQNLWGLRIGLYALGVSSGIYLPSGIATLTTMVPKQVWGRGLAIHQMAPSLALIVGPLWADFILGWNSWRVVIWPIAGVCLVVGAVFWKKRTGPTTYGSPPSWKAIRVIFFQRSFWIMVFLLGVAIGLNLGIYAMLPLYLTQEKDMALSLSNNLLALSRVLGLVTPFLAGFSVDRFGPKATMIGVLLTVGLSSLFLGITSGNWLIICLFMQSMFSVAFFPPAYSALARIACPQDRNIIISLAMPVSSVLGVGIVPTVLGLLGDAGRFGLGITLLGCLCLLCTMLAVRIKLPAAEVY